jgi:hypothetical protein
MTNDEQTVSEAAFTRWWNTATAIRDDASDGQGRRTDLSNAVMRNELPKHLAEMNIARPRLSAIDDMKQQLSFIIWKMAGIDLFSATPYLRAVQSSFSKLSLIFCIRFSSCSLKYSSVVRELPARLRSSISCNLAATPSNFSSNESVSAGWRAPELPLTAPALTTDCRGCNVSTNMSLN